LEITSDESVTDFTVPEVVWFETAAGFVEAAAFFAVAGVV
jgi:hypothetical protein